MRIALLAAVFFGSALATPYFPVWLDNETSTAAWYDLIETWAGKTFKISGKTIHTGMYQHGAIHRFADPKFLQAYDDKLRAFNGALARDSTGSVDRCGWPDKPADKAGSQQYHRRTTPLHIDFKNGLDPSELVVSLTKGCCQRDRYTEGNKFSHNLNIVKDTVNGKEKNVLALTAWNKDDPFHCPGKDCYKIVTSSGTVATADLFASGKYEVIARVANASGLVWAIWTFHYEEHLPKDCADYSCWCKAMPNDDIRKRNQCESRNDGSGQPCRYDTTCDNYTDGWSPKQAPPSPMMTPAQCGAMHDESDPQFLGNNSFGGWATQVNHEIDIEIPANCVGSYNVCNKSDAADPGVISCAGDYSTANLNNYIYTQHSGTGPMYSNACVRVANEDGSPRNLIADGEYHNYTIVWHTGPPGYTEFYIDGVYMGTNNVFVPTRGSRFYIAHWPAPGKNPVWNGRPDEWDGGYAGDGIEHNITTYVSSVKITPFDEPNDIMAPSISDQPDGCTQNYKQRWPGVCHETWERQEIPPGDTPSPPLPPSPPSPPSPPGQCAWESSIVPCTVDSDCEAWIKAHCQPGQVTQFYCAGNQFCHFKA